MQGHWHSKSKRVSFKKKVVNKYVVSFDQFASTTSSRRKCILPHPRRTCRMCWRWRWWTRSRCIPRSWLWRWVRSRAGRWQQRKRAFEWPHGRATEKVSHLEGAFIFLGRRNICWATVRSMRRLIGSTLLNVVKHQYFSGAKPVENRPVSERVQFPLNRSLLRDSNLLRRNCKRYLATSLVWIQDCYSVRKARSDCPV